MTLLRPSHLKKMRIGMDILKKGDGQSDYDIPTGVRVEALPSYGYNDLIYFDTDALYAAEPGYSEIPSSIEMYVA